MRVLDAVVAGSLVLSTSFCGAIAPPKRPVAHIQKRSSLYSVGTPHAFNFTMPVDHFTKSDTRTYNNEYWVNDTFYRPGGPVFVYDLGEYGSTADEAASQISYGDSAFSHLLQQYHGLGIAWQHRFYGYSLPFELDENRVPKGGLKAFQYMTQEQAMEDVVYFAQNIQGTQKKLSIPGDNVLDPDKTPWIFIGGSYPGMRAALLRIRNPEVIYASWASSAPLQPDPDGSAYFNAALRSMPANCTADFHKTVKWMDKMFDDKNATAIRFIQERTWLATALANNESKTLNAKLAHNLTFAEMAKTMQKPLSMGKFMHAGPALLREWCELMETYDAANAVPETTIDNYSKDLVHYVPPSDKGIFDKHGPEKTLDAFWSSYVWLVNENFHHMKLSKRSEKAAKSESEIIEEWGMIAWSWQNLHELGNFLGWSPNYEKWHKDDSILSKYYTWEDNRLDQIKDLVGVEASDVPEVTSYWAKYGGWGMQPSNVMFTDGEWDPWRAFAPGSEEYEMGKPVRNFTTEIPACGVPLDGNKLYGQLYRGPTSAHCSDLGSLEEANPSRSKNLFMLALNAWLPCFHADD